MTALDQFYFLTLASPVLHYQRCLLIFFLGVQEKCQWYCLKSERIKCTKFNVIQLILNHTHTKKKHSLVFSKSVAYLLKHRRWQPFFDHSNILHSHFKDLLIMLEKYKNYSFQWINDSHRIIFNQLIKASQYYFSDDQLYCHYYYDHHHY